MDTTVLRRAKRRSAKTKSPRNLPSRHILIILAITGMALRLFFLRYRFAVGFDEVNYLKLGVSGYLGGLGDILHTYWSPLLPGLISFSSYLFDNYELAGRMVSITASTLLIFPVYSIGKFVYDQRVGLVAGAFVAFFPPLAFQSTLALTEPVYMLSATFAILFGLRMLKQYSAGFATLAGLSAGLAYLAHPQGIGFICLLALWIIVGAATKTFLIRPLRAVWLLVPLVLAFFVVAAPYLAYLKQETGKWTLSAKGSANWQMDAPKKEAGDPFRSLNENNTIVPIDQIFHQGDFLQGANGSQKPVREVHLGSFIIKYIKNIAEILSSSIPQLFTLAPLLFFGVGLLGRSWRAQQGIMLIYLLSFVGFYWFGLIPAFHINLRYFLPLLPLCGIWVAVGALHIHEWLSAQLPLSRLAERRRRRSGYFATIVLLIGFLGLGFLPEFGRVISRSPSSKDYWADPVEQKKAGLWLRENAAGPKIIMSRGHAVDVYAGNFDITQSVTIPKGNLGRVLAYAKHRGVDYLVINERYRDAYPELAFLLASNDRVPGLKLVYDVQSESQLKTRIFQIL